MSGDKDRITLDDVAQFDARLQLSVMDAVARVYAASIGSKDAKSDDLRRIEAARDVDHFLQMIAPLVVGSRE